MKSSPAEIKKVLDLLADTLHRLERTSSLSEARLYFSPDKKTWSIAQVLAHLRSSADVWGETGDDREQKTHSLHSGAAAGVA